MEKYIIQQEASQLVSDYYRHIIPKGVMDWVDKNIRELAENGKCNVCIKECHLEDMSLMHNRYPMEDRWDLHDLTCTRFCTGYEMVNVKEKRFLFFHRWVRKEVSFPMKKEMTLVSRKQKRIDTLVAIAEWARSSGFDVEMSKGRRTFARYGYHDYEEYSVKISWYELPIKA